MSLTQRKERRIGGSDIGKLLGDSKYGNAMDVYMRIVDGIDDVWNQPMERGAAMEPVLRAHGQNFLGITLEHPESDYHEHPGNDFARAQVDDLATWRGLPVCVDYKSVNRWQKGWGAEGSDDVPKSIRAQVAWEMFCTNRELTLVVAGFGEDMPVPVIFNMSHVTTYQVQRCGQFESYCCAVAKEFWEAHIIPRKPPNMKPLGTKAVKL